MKFRLEFNMDNAAFEDPSEVSRILRELAQRCELGLMYTRTGKQRLMDINGKLL